MVNITAIAILFALAGYVSPAGSVAASSSAAPDAGPAPLAANLATCLSACSAGPRAVEAFCRVIPHPVIRAACWGVVHAGRPACEGFCYWYFTP